MLSIDGGGIRGMFAASVLYNLRKALARNLSDTFSLVVGTSVGALLGALIASGKEEQLENIMRRPMYPAFFDEGLKETLLPFVTCSYKGVVKQQTLQQYFGVDSRVRDCKIPLIVSTYDWTEKRPKVFESDRITSDLCTWSLLDAATAAPTYFPPVKLIEPQSAHLYLDAGIALNNPGVLAIAEATERWPNDEICVFSIGCGRAKEARMENLPFCNWSSMDWTLHGIVNLLQHAPSQMYEHLAEQFCTDYLRMDTDLSADMDDEDMCTQLWFLSEGDRAFTDTYERIVNFFA